MTEVDFYVLNSESADASIDLVCRLTERAVRRHQSVFIHADEPTVLDTLDQRLWSFRLSSFIPHRRLDDHDLTLPAAVNLAALDGAADDPVILSCGEPTGDRQILINLAREVPAFFSRVPRTLEIVDQRPAVRDQGRSRYRFYQQRGYPLRHHAVEPA